MYFLALYSGAMTYIPAVILKAYILPYFRQTYRIKMTTDGFGKLAISSWLLAIGPFLYQTVSPAVMVRSSEDAVFAVNDRQHLFARGV